MSLNVRLLSITRNVLGDRPRSRALSASVEALDSIEDSSAARHAGNRDQYKVMLRRPRALLRRDKVRYVMDLAENVTTICLPSSEKKMCSKFLSR